MRDGIVEHRLEIEDGRLDESLAEVQHYKVRYTKGNSVRATATYYQHLLEHVAIHFPLGHQRRVLRLRGDVPEIFIVRTKRIYLLEDFNRIGLTSCSSPAGIARTMK